MPACPNCGQDNPEIARFCLACGASLAAEAASPREERKVVTVLFCDLVGSTARAEGADPEDVRALLSAYHERVRSELERFGGTVEKFIGDAVMALFGAPVAHEDDPERAVRAGLAIRDWAAEDGDLQVRIGITTGEALVTLSAVPQVGEGMASGDVVNTAARLQSAAPENGILVDETTFRATDRAIDYVGHRPVEAKGKAEPMAVWEVQQTLARVEVEREGRAPFVGRERELDVLLDALRRVREDREPQLVTLVGVPGIGKSRLVYELYKAIEADGELTFWRHGRSLPYGEGISFWALGQIVKAQAGILDTDDAVTAGSKLREAVRTFVRDAADAPWVERHLMPLVGLEAVADLAADRGSEAFAAWRRFLEALAEHRPLALVFDDLHFADDGLLDFVDYLADWTTGVPILIVGTARPELLSRRPGWGGGKANAVTLSLGALSDEETARLVHALLERPVLDATLQDALLDRAGGNPLYAEEFVRMLEERGQAEQLPETVQGLLAARLDGLPPDEKALLQDAAVVGRTFWLGAAVALSGVERRAAEERLHALGRKEFVRRERRSAVAGEVEYAFRHLLVRDVAYGQIPRGDRAEKHRRAAEWLDSLSPDRSEDRAEMLAHHYERALDLARATGRDTGDLGDRAGPALREAGDRALALNAFPAAARYYERALEIWPEGDREHPRVLLGYGKALHLGEQRGADELIAARDAFMARGDVEGAAEAEAAVGELRWETEQVVALDHLEHAVELLRSRPASPTKAYALTSLARLKSFTRKEHEAIALCREALALAEELKLDELRARALNYLGTARSLSGDEGGLGDLEQSLEVALAVNAPVEALRAYNNLAGLMEYLGKTRRARELYLAGLNLAKRIGSRHDASWFRRQYAAGLLAGGNWDEALDLIADEAPGDWPPVREFVELARGRPEDFVSFATEELEPARQSGRADHLAGALMIYAYALLEAGERTEAETIVEELIQILPAGYTNVSSSYLLPVVVSAVGQTDGLLRAFATGTQTPWVEAARWYVAEEFAAAADCYAELDDRMAEAYSRLRAAERLITAGRSREGEAQLQKALVFYRSVGATRYIREGEALLAKTA